MWGIPGCHCGDPWGCRLSWGLGDRARPLPRGRRGACRSPPHSLKCPALRRGPFPGSPSSQRAEARPPELPLLETRPPSEPQSPSGQWLACCPYSCGRWSSWTLRALPAAQVLTGDPCFVPARLPLASARGASTPPCSCCPLASSGPTSSQVLGGAALSSLGAVWSHLPDLGSSLPPKWAALSLLPECGRGRSARTGPVRPSSPTPVPSLDPCSSRHSSNLFPFIFRF